MKLKKETRTVCLRDFDFAEESNGMVLRGYASVFEKPTVLVEYEGIEYKEVIDRNAFNNSDFSLCCMKYNHNDGIPILSRVRGGFMTLRIDDFGLKFESRLFNTAGARDVYQIIKEGGLDKCSFGFTVKNEEYNRDTRTRRILEIDKVFDISIVDVPAYDDTSVIALRSLFEAEAEKQKMLESEILEKRKRAILRTYL